MWLQVVRVFLQLTLLEQTRLAIEVRLLFMQFSSSLGWGSRQVTKLEQLTIKMFCTATRKRKVSLNNVRYHSHTLALCHDSLYFSYVEKTQSPAGAQYFLPSSSLSFLVLSSFSNSHTSILQINFNKKFYFFRKPPGYSTRRLLMVQVAKQTVRK